MSVHRKLYDLLEAIQTNGGNGARAAVFFAAFAFMLSQMCVNVVACGTVGGMDLAALLPRCVCLISEHSSVLNLSQRYLDIRRGSVLIAIIGICINPWKILNVRPSSIHTLDNSSWLSSNVDCQYIHLCNIRIRCISRTVDGYYVVREHCFSYSRWFSLMFCFTRAEYYLIRRRKLKLSHLYLPDSRSDYWYV